MGRKSDRFWDYAQDLKGHFKCNFCKCDFAGGVSRIKSHLAGVKGHDIPMCEVVPEYVQKEAYEATQGTNKNLKGASTSSSDVESEASNSISTIQEEKIVTQSMEDYVAEIFFDDVVDRLITSAANLMSFDSLEELKNFLETLYKIKFALHAAQMRQVSDDSVRIWLTNLQDVVYEADNLLDKIGYEILRQKVCTQNQAMDQVCNLNRVKTINQLLAKIVNTVVHFNLRMEFATSNPKIILDKNMDSLVNDSEVVGRGYDVINIVNKLTSSSNQHGISVLPIVGVAGLGKSTLAKEVYNHEQVKKHFNVLVWVHVSKNLDVKGILREILKSLNKDLILIGLEDDAILKELSERMHGKKYLLVLDDVRNGDHEEWNTLRRYLLRINSSASNNIIVTTRSNNVAQIMGTVSPYCLDELSNDECWSILVKRAFANEPTLDLEAIGIEIAKKCRRVPWAARVLGGTMYLKNDKSEWLSIRDNFIWDLLDDDNRGIFHVLKLSFDHLPIPSLKRCFAYCAIFPEDYDMKKDELIQHWMAEGFLEPLTESNMEMEDVGNTYFNIFLATTFFQNARKDAYGNIISCKMHDLVHDFALKISESKTLILEQGSVDRFSHIRCSFVHFDGQMTPRIPFAGTMQLRTLVSENADFDNTLSNFKSLRVLKLSGVSITALPDTIEQLIHLRLLHVSQTKIRELPKSTTKLYNLQTLRIEDCCHLTKLPEDLSNLIKLRHIHIDHFKDPSCRKQTPKNMGQLIFLQTLPYFTVDQDEGRWIKELGCLNKLRGELDIYNLEYVRDKEEARSASLAEKTKIFKLGFHWGLNFGRVKDFSDNEEDVLEGLQPHQNLKSLTIERFKGSRFPSWLLTGHDTRNGLLLFDNLIELTLSECCNCEEVPTLGHLPCLRVLEIIGMKNVKCIRIEFYGDGIYRNALFPALRRLQLKGMERLEEWKVAEELTTAGEVFPCLEELIIENCGQLISAPCHFPALKKLMIINVSKTAFKEISSKLTTLVSLVISGVPEYTSMEKQLYQNNMSLLEIRDGEELVSSRPHELVSEHTAVAQRWTKVFSVVKWLSIHAALKKRRLQ